MGTFYGTIQGNRGEATRMGSKSSGFRASAQSYDGSVITELSYRDNEDTKDETLVISINLSDSSSSYYGKNYFYGTLEQLKECFSMYQEYLNEQEEIRRHDYVWYNPETDSIRRNDEV